MENKTGIRDIAGRIITRKDHGDISIVYNNLLQRDTIQAFAELLNTKPDKYILSVLKSTFETIIELKEEIETLETKIEQLEEEINTDKAETGIGKFYLGTDGNILLEQIKDELIRIIEKQQPITLLRELQKL